MWRFPTISAALFGLVSSSAVTTPTRAEAYPVCLAGGQADSVQCDYTTLAQCRAAAAGGLGYCITNPRTADAYARYDRGGKRNR